jgi:hypothetical protein
MSLSDLKEHISNPAFMAAFQSNNLLCAIITQVTTFNDQILSIVSNLQSANARPTVRGALSKKAKKASSQTELVFKEDSDDLENIDMADISISDLHSYISTADEDEAFVALCNSDYSVNSEDKKGDTLMHIALRRRFERVVLHLLIRGADLRKENLSNVTPLKLAEELSKKDPEFKDISRLLSLHDFYASPATSSRSTLQDFGDVSPIVV